MAKRKATKRKPAKKKAPAKKKPAKKKSKAAKIPKNTGGKGVFGVVGIYQKKRPPKSIE